MTTFGKAIETVRFIVRPKGGGPELASFGSLERARAEVTRVAKRTGLPASIIKRTAWPIRGPGAWREELIR